ncbi:MAG: ParB/Srx family N-terminal domain-containing protein [Candidatus Binatia bacterium]
MKSISKKQKANEFQWWPIDQITPYEKNAKLHDDEQIDSLAHIIDEFGFNQPIVVDEQGVIIAGHGRRLAALKLGYDSAPVTVVKGLSEEKKKAYRIADNMVSRGGYDEALLADEIMGLASADDFDLSLLGMGNEELDDLIDKFTPDFEDMGLDDVSDENLSDITPASEKPDKPIQSVDYKPSFAVVVECSGEIEQQEIYNQLTAEGRSCKIQTI